MDGLLRALVGVLVKQRSRIRGSGWLICPNCHEHASQDVVDQMTFLSFFFYRLTPVARHRILHCRRCDFKRPSTSGEMAKLETSGTSIKRAWLFPVGLIGILAAAFFGYVFIVGSADSAVIGDLKFSPISGGVIAPAVQVEIPNTWNVAFAKSHTPPQMIVNETSGTQMAIYVIRDPGHVTLQTMMEAHYKDIVNFNAQQVPRSVPAGECAHLGGEAAYKIEYTFKAAGNKAVMIVYVVVHDGVGYALTFTGQSDDGITKITAIAHHVSGSFEFTAQETPDPSAIASASPSVAPTPTPTPTPIAATTPAPSGTPTATPGPTPDYAC